MGGSWIVDPHTDFVLFYCANTSHVDQSLNNALQTALLADLRTGTKKYYFQQISTATGTSQTAYSRHPHNQRTEHNDLTYRQIETDRSQLTNGHYKTWTAGYGLRTMDWV